MQLLHHLVVQRLACGLIGALARLGQPLIDLRVAVAAVVQRAFAVDKAVDAAVRIRATRPAGEAQLIVAALLSIQQRGEFGHLQVQVKSGLGDHRLQYLAHLLRGWVVRHQQVDGQRRGNACRLQQRFGFVDVTRRDRQVDVIRADRGKRLVCRGVKPFEDHLVQRIAVDGL